MKKRGRRRLISQRDYIVLSTRICLVLTLFCAVTSAILLRAALGYTLSRLNEALCAAGMYRTPAPASTLALTSPDIACEAIDGVSVGESMLAIARLDMSRSDALTLSNETDYEPDLEALALEYLSADGDTSEARAVSAVMHADGDDAPLVLILHTHGTESYTDEGVQGFERDYVPPRSQDITKNVVAVGAVIADVLNLSGVPTLHCEIMHDAESYLHSYERSLETVLEYLNRYPSIKYILDVHRDAITTSSGALVDPVTEVNGERTAQLMFVVGTDGKGAKHPSWRKNLSLAAALQKSLTQQCNGIARPINLRGASFNQQYSEGSLLVEIGSAASTLAEATRAAVLFAQTFAETIQG